MATVIDGKATSQAVRERVAREAAAFISETGHTPGLVTILVGEDPASQVYVRSKGERCREVGMASFHDQLPATAGQDEVESAVARWNADDRVDGILVQLPLPAQLDSEPVLELIDPSKDVDGFHPVNVGLLVPGQPGLRPCTPAGVMGLLREHETGRRGRARWWSAARNIVGKPMALLLLRRAPPSPSRHSRTRDLAEVTRAGRHPGRRRRQARDDHAAKW